RCDHRELRVRDHRRERQDRAVHRPDAAARAGRSGTHRHRRDPQGSRRPVIAMPYDFFLALVVFAFVMAFTPGPNNIMLTASGVNFGFTRTIPHMAGVSIGMLILLAACAAGLGLVFTAAPALHVGLKFVGGVYMLWLAWKVATAK